MADVPNGLGSIGGTETAAADASSIAVTTDGQGAVNESSGLPPATTVTNGAFDSSHSHNLTSVEGASHDPRPISAEEIALYDRQIRLWGVKAQEKLRSAQILLIGMKALATEVAKNLVLAGIGSLTVIDHQNVTENDLCSQFLLSRGDIGKNRAQAALPQILRLNPRVALHADSSPIISKSPEYFSPFDIIIATGLDIETLKNINAYCRIYNRKFYAADIHGMYGWAFADLISHDFVVEREKGNKPTKLRQEPVFRLQPSGRTER